MPFDVDTARLVRQYLEYGKAWEVYFKFVVPAVDVVKRFWDSVAGGDFLLGFVLSYASNI